MNLPSTPSMRLDGKRALVTGASRGIGLGGAVALAEAGAHVVMVARSADDIEAAADAACQAGYKCRSADTRC
ncbi:MAG: SDR family NAD(P)-dependent oxidoreductase [Nitratireductor sp.]